VADGDPRETSWAGDYAAYVQRHMDGYPLVFYGWSDPSLDGDGAPPAARIRAFAESAAARSRRYYPHISAAYAPGNPVPIATRFDVRSLPYGIGSLSRSRAVTDTARLWLFVWKQARGDLWGTPFLKPGGGPRAAGKAP
jgi:hypothetical protein